MAVQRSQARTLASFAALATFAVKIFFCNHRENTKDFNH